MYKSLNRLDKSNLVLLWSTKLVFKINWPFGKPILSLNDSLLNWLIAISVATPHNRREHVFRQNNTIWTVEWLKWNNAGDQIFVSEANKFSPLNSMGFSWNMTAFCVCVIYHAKILKKLFTSWQKRKRNTYKCLFECSNVI